MNLEATSAREIFAITLFVISTWFCALRRKPATRYRTILGVKPRNAEASTVLTPYFKYKSTAALSIASSLGLWIRLKA